ncbi:MAG TPA: tRNA guanosine(34) transglycosylase Tgt [Solirubrobacteraceae bacterium]|nr:tRNA guanosine(34) transglycosylase Tgt [Solirubrobacteraceae bacterium]
MGATFTVEQRDAASRGRTGTLRLAHGDVRTPAFVPLATRGAVRGLLPREVTALGYEMVLGNTYHLMLDPGPETIAGHGGLHGFMGWDRPIVTDSGGFQVFSMGHGSVADEVKGRGQAGGTDGAVLAIEEEGVRFRSYFDGSERLLSPEGSMAIQAALGSDVALAFDECTPFHVSREYTERSTERTHRWLKRCLNWHAEHAPAEQLLFGIVQGGVHEDLRRESARRVAESGCQGVAIGGSLGRDKRQMHEVVSWATDELSHHADAAPRHLLGIGEVDDLIRGVELGVDLFDCAMPTRLARHGMALVPEPDARWRTDLTKAASRDELQPVLPGCRCEACASGYSRAYLRHLIRARELTGMRLLTVHNLMFIADVMADLRAALADGNLAETAAALRAGAAPATSRAVVSP